MSVVQECPASETWPGQFCKYDNKQCCAPGSDSHTNSMTWSYQQWVIPENTPAGECGANGSNCQSVVPLCTSRYTNRAVCNDNPGENSAGEFKACLPGFTQIFNVNEEGPSGIHGSFGSNPPATQSICQPTMNMRDIVTKYVGKAWGDGARNDYLNNSNNRMDLCINWDQYGGKYFTQSCAIDITDPSGTWHQQNVAGKVGSDGKPIDLETGMLGKTRCSLPYYTGRDKVNAGAGCFHLANPDAHKAMGLGDNFFNGSLDSSQSDYAVNVGDHIAALNVDGIFINRPAEKTGPIKVGPGDCSNEGSTNDPFNSGGQFKCNSPY